MKIICNKKFKINRTNVRKSIDKFDKFIRIVIRGVKKTCTKSIKLTANCLRNCVRVIDKSISIEIRGVKLAFPLRGRGTDAISVGG